MFTRANTHTHRHIYKKNFIPSSLIITFKIPQTYVTDANAERKLIFMEVSPFHICTTVPLKFIYAYTLICSHK